MWNNVAFLDESKFNLHFGRRKFEEGFSDECLPSLLLVWMLKGSDHKADRKDAYIPVI